MQVDTIFHGGLVVTMDSQDRVIENGAVAVQDDIIIEIGSSEAIVSKYTADRHIDCAGCAITPGLINAHTHAAMTLLRGLADDLRLDVWLIGYMMPTEREFVNPDFVRLGTLLACAEMIASGVTTFNDMYYFEDTVATAAAEAGIRAICGQTVLKFPAPDAASYEESMRRCRDFVVKWKGHPLIIPAVAPHAPYTCTAEILQECTALAKEFDVPLHIHISETAFEVQENREQHGMPVIPYVKKLGLFEAKVIAAHCVHIDEGEVRTLQHNHAGVSHNPSSNLKLASGIAPVRKMLDLGVKVGIGTDGPASNNDLDMFEETRLAAFIAKVATDNPTTLPAKQAFAMATRLGAQALHIGDITGSLEANKRADLIVIDLGNVHNWPQFRRSPDSIYSQLVYATKSTDVRHVMCNGKLLFHNRELTTIDAHALMPEAAEMASRIDAFLSAREGDVLSRVLAIGELQREESFEIQVKSRIEGIAALDDLLAREDVSVVKYSHYRQYDTYFEFDASDSRIRYREDDALENSSVTNVRSRLTLTERAQQRDLGHAILLSRSRYISPATRSLRFYQEYFKADREKTVIKERKRWHIDYKGLRLYINLDQVTEPRLDGYFLEIKSRTWSLNDAESKAQVMLELLNVMGVEEKYLILDEYIGLVAKM